ncbi:MAG TPA: hypothetical protein VFL57_14985 [Bryobacteraceae bacterium]|nr:hypothetical protein [Bryobacteraceae bacterium]
MLRTLVLLPVGACLAIAQTPPPSPWQYVHPNAVIVGGIEWHKASQSPFLRELKRELGSSLKVTQHGDPAAMDAIDAIYFSAADLPDGTDMKDTSGLALVRVRSSLEPLLKSFGKGRARRQNYNGIELVIPQGGRSADWRIAILDNRHALMGDWPSLRAALNRTSPAAETPLIMRAKLLAANADLWFAIDKPGTAVPGNPMLADVRGVDATVSFANRAELMLQLVTEAPEKAAGLAAALNLMTSALPARPKSLSITAAEATVRIAATTTAADIRAAAAAFEQRIKSTVQVSTATARPGVRREPELPPEKQVIRIHGLEEGVREIPLRR